MEEDLDEEEFDEELQEEIEEAPRPPQKSQMKQQVRPKEKPQEENTDKFVAVHQPEVVGLMDKTTGNVQTEIWAVLADIRNSLTRIEENI